MGEKRTEVLDFRSGATLELSGAVSGCLTRPEGWRELASLSALEPAIAGLARDLERHGAGPIDRSRVLRAGGFGQLFIEITARCNERCVHCYADSGPEREEFLERETVEAILADARALGFRSAQLTGGDPLMHPDCAALAEHALSLGFEAVEIYTNGLLLSSKQGQRLLELPLHWAFSLYSHEAAVHDAITRVEGSHARTSRAIERVIAAGRETRVGVVLMDENRAAADDVVRYAESLGVPSERVRSVGARAVGRGRDVAPVDLRSPSQGPTSGATERPVYGRAAVSATGEVYPCIFSRSARLGNVHEHSLREILDEPSPIEAPLERLLERATSWRDELTCWPCRATAALVGPERLLAGRAP